MTILKTALAAATGLLMLAAAAEAGTVTVKLSRSASDARFCEVTTTVKGFAAGKTVTVTVARTIGKSRMTSALSITPKSKKAAQLKARDFLAAEFWASSVKGKVSVTSSPKADKYRVVNTCT